VRRTARPLLLAVAVATTVAAPFVTSSTAASPLPTYASYDVGFNSGEPSIGYDTNLDAALFTADTTTVRMRWDAKDRLVEHKDVSAPNALTSLDPIGFTDQKTHRSFSSQLAGACSLLAYSDDGGSTWTPSSGCGPATFLDHQTVGSGPYPAEGAPATAGLTGYPDAVYYCAQNSYQGSCARSDDGGLTFPFASQAYNNPAVTVGGQVDPLGGACSAIHGHLRVAPDGVVYLPNKGCGGTPTANNLTNSEFFGGQAAVAVSEDSGTTWDVRKVPGSHNPDQGDPSVAFDKDSTVYFGWGDGINPTENELAKETKAMVAVSHDHGKTWTKPIDVGASLGIHNAVFAEMIAGDPGRAAFSFIGSKSLGDTQHNGFVGEWHLYVATTLNGGKSWTTVDATPKDPVQRGCVLLQGTSNKNVADNNLCNRRNLLDFNDITVDKQGRVLVAYTDGCVAACVTDPKNTVKSGVSKVLRQTTGPLLYAKGAYPTKVTKPATKPVTTPVTTPTTPSTGNSGALAATGGAPALALVSLLLVGGALVLRRRRV
jgi:hypothetical protein